MRPLHAVVVGVIGLAAVAAGCGGAIPSSDGGQNGALGTIKRDDGGSNGGGGGYG
jgi:hypothetical protein